MAKNRNTYRQREMEKKRKAEDKRARRRKKKEEDDEVSGGTAELSPSDSTATEGE